jgi:hypothetical protein
MPSNSPSFSKTDVLDPDGLLDQSQVAKILNTTEKFLEGRRYRGKGVPFVRIGRLVRYRRQDVERFISDNLCQSTSEASANQPKR